MAKRLGTRAFTVSHGDARAVAKTSQGQAKLIESDPAESEFAELLGNQEDSINDNQAQTKQQER